MISIADDPAGVKSGDNGMSAGIARRDAAHSQIEADHAGTLLIARRMMALYLLEFGEVTADTVQDLISLPATVNPVLLGAAPKLFARRGWIRADGQVRSRRPQAHARWLMKWVLVDAAALAAWLAATPMPEPVGVVE